MASMRNFDFSDIQNVLGEIYGQMDVYVNAQNERQQRADNDVQRYRDVNRKLTQQLEASKDERNKVAQQMNSATQKLRMTLRECEKDTRILKQDALTLQRSLAEMKNRNGVLTSEMQARGAEAVERLRLEAQESVNAQQVVIDDLRNQLSQVTRAAEQKLLEGAAQMEQQAKTLTNEITSLRRNNDESTRQNTDLQKLLTDKSRQLESLKEEQLQLVQQIDVMNDERNENLMRLTNAERQLAVVKRVKGPRDGADLQPLKTSYTERAKRLAELEGTSDPSRDIVAGLRDFTTPLPKDDDVTFATDFDDVVTTTAPKRRQTADQDVMQNEDAILSRRLRKR